MLSGRFGSAFGDYPAIGAVVAHETGFRGQLPPYVAIPRNPSFTWELGKSAFLGGRYESFKTGDPERGRLQGAGRQPRRDADARTAPHAGRRCCDAVDTLAKEVQGNDQIATYDEFHQRAAAMILSNEARGAFAIDQESDRLRDRYGRTTFGQSCSAGPPAGRARRALRDGQLSAAGTITPRSGTASDKKLPEFDRGFSALLEDLHDRGLLADTLVLAFGEFGRTPKINKDAGRDHWGPAASLLFAGAGVRGGQVIGATDKQGAYVTRRPVAPADVACTVYEALGIDPRKYLVAPDGRPIEILDTGENIKELYA